MAEADESNGIPIYSDDTEYVFSDTVSGDTGPLHMQPSNIAAHKLYRCIEGMRDMVEVLEMSQVSQDCNKRRRRIKLLFTPLFSFIESLIDLLHDIQTNPDTKSLLASETVPLVSELEKQLKANVPVGKSELIRKIRNKMSAHIDKDMRSHEAQQMYAEVKTSDVGLWLHSSLKVLTELIKLPIYQWSCGTRFPNCVGVFAPMGPLLTIFNVDGQKLSSIAGCFFVNDPRDRVFDLLKKVAAQSQWMFGENDA